MRKFLIARIVIVRGFLLVLYFGIIALKTGKAKSRGYTFHRDDDPMGYRFTVIISLVGPVAIIYLMLTR